MIKLNGERLERYALNRTVTVAPRHGNRLHEVRVQQSEASEPITVPTREEGGAIVADIPNVFMERYGTITVEVVSVDKHGSRNSEKRSFVIHNQEKPDGYEYEENVSYGGASSWNDLSDKPFYEEKAFEPIVWDGNTEGMESLDMGDGLMFYKVSDEPITDPACIDSLVLSNGTDTTTYDAEEVGVTIQPFGFMMRTYVMSVAEDTDLGEGTLPKGLWFMWMNGTFISGVNPKSTVKTLDEKYMPILTSPSGKKFKLSVDDSGVISATEV